MHGPGIGSALGLLVLELVHLTEDLDRNEDMVVFKTVQAIRVMEQDIRIEDEVLYDARVFLAFGFAGGRTRRNYWKEDALFFGGFQRGSAVHVGFIYNGGVSLLTESGRKKGWRNHGGTSLPLCDLQPEMLKPHRINLVAGVAQLVLCISVRVS
jgi:hypothetical protein